MEKKLKITKESLLKENAVLKEQLRAFNDQDEARRVVLSELLDSYEYQQEYGYATRSKKVIVRSWLGISFLIGELKADANYAMVIESRENLRQEVDRLQRELYDLKNPPSNPSPLK